MFPPVRLTTGSTNDGPGHAWLPGLNTSMSASTDPGVTTFPLSSIRSSVSAGAVPVPEASHTACTRQFIVSVSAPPNAARRVSVVSSARGSDQSHTTMSVVGGVLGAPPKMKSAPIFQTTSLTGGSHGLVSYTTVTAAPHDRPGPGKLANGSMSKVYSPASPSPTRSVMSAHHP